MVNALTGELNNLSPENHNQDPSWMQAPSDIESQRNIHFEAGPEFAHEDATGTLEVVSLGLEEPLPTPAISNHL